MLSVQWQPFCLGLNVLTKFHDAMSSGASELTIKFYHLESGILDPHYLWSFQQIWGINFSQTHIELTNVQFTCLSHMITWKSCDILELIAAYTLHLWTKSSVNSLWPSNGNIYLGQHWFRYWLGAVRHQSITWASVDSSSVRSSDTPLRAVRQIQPSITKISLKIVHLKFYQNLPRDNELICPVAKKILWIN